MPRSTATLWSSGWPRSGSVWRDRLGGHVPIASAAAARVAAAALSAGARRVAALGRQAARFGSPARLRRWRSDLAAWCRFSRRPSVSFAWRGVGRRVVNRSVTRGLVRPLDRRLRVTADVQHVTEVRDLFVAGSEGREPVLAFEGGEDRGGVVRLVVDA